MKNILIILILFSCYSLPQDVNTLFEKGNELYSNGQFEEAIENYNMILNENYESAELYYNLGNSYFRTGNLGKAVLYYEKGLKLSPNDEDLIHNLQFVNSKIVDKIEPLPVLFVFEWWGSFVKFFSYNTWIILTLIIFLLLLSTILFFLYGSNLAIQKISFAGGVFLIILLITFSFATYASIQKYKSENEGIILSQQIKVKFSPDDKSSDAFIIHEGTKFRIEDRFDNWLKIKIADGKVGWLLNDKIGII